jgi:hypothetical protein
LILEIMTFLPLSRKLELLKANGEMNPRQCELEVEVYKQSKGESGTYLAHYQDENRIVEKFVDTEEAEKAGEEAGKSGKSIVVLVVIDSPGEK